MDDLDFAQPRCPHCGTVMADHRDGFWCATCQHLEDHAAERAAVEIPPDFEGASIHGG